MTDAAALRREFDAFERAYQPGHHGRWVATKRADALDGWFRSAFAALGDPSGVAVVALGGYGRRLQLPRSDIDVMLLHDAIPPVDLAATAEHLSYPLWDEGFAVGLVVRSPDECAAVAGERLDTLTALLDGRHVAGDEAFAGSVVASVRSSVRSRPSVLVGLIDADAERRLDRFGSAAHTLEPDLKEGLGALRDVASIGWLAHSAGAPLGATGLVEAGFLRAGEAASVDAAEEFLVRARSAVHLATGKRTDRLLVDLQPEVAAGMGFTDEPRLLAADGLLRSTFEHARAVVHVTGAVRARLTRGPAATKAASEPLDAAGVLAALGSAAAASNLTYATLLDRLAAAAVPDPVRWDDRVLEEFVGLVRSGPSARDAFEVLDRLGLLPRYIPAWRDVRCRPQRDPYHRFTVDTHLVNSAVAVAMLLDASHDVADDRDPVGEMVSLVDHPTGLVMGALLHDIGKVGEGSHVQIGTSIAAAQLAPMPLDPADRELAMFLVAEHLLLPDTATRRDLTDEDLLLDVAARIGSPARLAALYLLARADAEATGPAAWTPWRRALVHELVAKLRRVFERGEMGEQLAATLAERIQEFRARLADEPERDVDRFVLRMPRGYFLAVPPDGAARHYRTIAPAVGSHEVRSVAVDGSQPGTFELLVVATDRPGLLSWIAGALAVSGISILSAQVFTTEDGVAVDWFEVVGAFEPTIDEARWRAFRTLLRRAIEGSIVLERRVEDKRRHYPSPRPGVPVTIGVDNDASEFSTVVEVGAPDRIGLLHDITRAFAELRVDVHVAKVATFDGRVVDAFYVRDALGRKIVDPEPLGEIERAVRTALTSRVAGAEGSVG